MFGEKSSLELDARAAPGAAPVQRDPLARLLQTAQIRTAPQGSRCDRPASLWIVTRDGRREWYDLAVEDRPTPAAGARPHVFLVRRSREHATNQPDSSGRVPRCGRGPVNVLVLGSRFPSNRVRASRAAHRPPQGRSGAAAAGGRITRAAVDLRLRSELLPAPASPHPAPAGWVRRRAMLRGTSPSRSSARSATARDPQPRTVAKSTSARPAESVAGVEVLEVRPCARSSAIQRAGDDASETRPMHRGALNAMAARTFILFAGHGVPWASQLRRVGSTCAGRARRGGRTTAQAAGRIDDAGRLPRRARAASDPAAVVLRGFYLQPSCRRRGTAAPRALSARGETAPARTKNSRGFHRRGRPFARVCARGWINCGPSSTRRIARRRRRDRRADGAAGCARYAARQRARHPHGWRGGRRQRDHDPRRLSRLPGPSRPSDDVELHVALARQTTPVAQVNPIAGDA